jgi:hypothetical protein
MRAFLLGALGEQRRQFLTMLCDLYTGSGREDEIQAHEGALPITGTSNHCYARMRDNTVSYLAPTTSGSNVPSGLL